MTDTNGRIFSMNKMVREVAADLFKNYNIGIPGRFAPEALQMLHESSEALLVE